MQLFKRILLSLFPDDIVGQSVNPASMFISFISPKDFFTVINKKIVENYKLNLFDVTLDPFEFKVGFGEATQLKAKSADTYYGYAIAANLNGYRFFSPSTIANSVSLVSALQVKDIFAEYPSEYYLHFLYAVYLLHFVFAARIKVFPYTDRQKNYNRCVDLFFSFYAFVFQQTGKTPNAKTMLAIKKDLLNQGTLFFTLLEVYHHLNELFMLDRINDKDFYAWLFYDELKTDLHKKVYEDFVQYHHEYTKSTWFSALEAKVLQYILPADVLLRYLWTESNMMLITETIVARIFDKKTLDEYIQSFRKDAHQLEAFLGYITDYRLFKRNFFAGVQKYIITSFRTPWHEDITEELDDLMSSIGGDPQNLEGVQIPERIKKESKFMEKILNFYLTFVGGFWISRGESFFLRMFRYPLLQKLINRTEGFDEKPYTLLFYWSLLNQYGRNVFYYKYTSDHVRAGKQKFVLPLKPTSKHIYGNIALLKFFEANFLAIILQDINPKDMRIYLKHKKILEVFRSLLGKQISDVVTGTNKTVLQTVYGGLARHLSDIKGFVWLLSASFTENDYFHLKESLYSLDYRVAQVFYEWVHAHKLSLGDNYSDMAILGIFAHARDTLFGFLLYMHFLQGHETSKKPLHRDLLLTLYIQDILHLDPYYTTKMKKVIAHVADTFQDILAYWIDLDDNKEYLTLALDNWSSFCNSKGGVDPSKKYVGEDILWFAWFLKNITYYNKRFLIPK